MKIKWLALNKRERLQFYAIARESLEARQNSRTAIFGDMSHTFLFRFWRKRKTLKFSLRDEFGRAVKRGQDILFYAWERWDARLSPGLFTMTQSSPAMEKGSLLKFLLESLTSQQDGLGTSRWTFVMACFNRSKRRGSPGTRFETNWGML